MIDFPSRSPHDPEITKLVQDLAEEALQMGDIATLKVFWYFDDELDRTAKDVLFETEEFGIWFDKYYQDNHQYWDRSNIIVYSDTIEGRDEVRFHVVLGADLPVYALCVNRKTGQAQWYLQETPVANLLASKMK